jgi:hypothetical protein
VDRLHPPQRPTRVVEPGTHRYHDRRHGRRNRGEEQVRRPQPWGQAGRRGRQPESLSRRPRPPDGVAVWPPRVHGLDDRRGAARKATGSLRGENGPEIHAGAMTRTPLASQQQRLNERGVRAISAGRDQRFPADA